MKRKFNFFKLFLLQTTKKLFISFNLINGNKYIFNMKDKNNNTPVKEGKEIK